MHIDHQKLVELLVETSSMGAEEVEKRLKELVGEIKQAIEGGDGYEIPGFGMFTGFGDVLTFIPSKELEMEINYKYAGMQPIELEEAQVQQEEEPKQESSEEPVEEVIDNPFAGLIDDEDIAEVDKKAQEAAEEAEEESTTEEEPASETEEEVVPGPDKWGIDTYQDESATSVFDTMLGADVEEPTADEEPAQEEAVEEEASEEIQEELQEEVSEENSLNDELADVLGDSDLDDPFEEVISEQPEEEPEAETKPPVEEETETKKKPKKKDVIPVIKNVSSGAVKKNKKADKEEADSTVEEEATEAPKEKTLPKKPKKQPQPVSSSLILLTVFVLALAGAAALVFFDVITIPGFNDSPQPVATNTTTPPPPAREPVVDEDDPVGTTATGSANTPVTNEDNTAQTEEQPPATEDPVATLPVEQPAVNTVTAETPGAEDDMGLFGKAQNEMTEVYTIVLYSLSNEQNARAKIIELEQEGLKARITPFASEQFGTLWRISVGHFSTITEAAIATDDLDPKYTENFFITKL